MSLCFRLSFWHFLSDCYTFCTSGNRNKYLTVCLLSSMRIHSRKLSATIISTMDNLAAVKSSLWRTLWHSYETETPETVSQLYVTKFWLQQDYPQFERPWPTTSWSAFDQTGCSQLRQKVVQSSSLAITVEKFFVSIAIKLFLHSHRFFYQSFISRMPHFVILRSNSKKWNFVMCYVKQLRRPHTIK